jgi:nuclear pore complex protein Nup205
VLLADSVSFSDLLQELLMEQLETFIEAFITNLPDVLRKLRVDEDEQRQLSKEHEHDLDLERFIVIISYAFENRPKAAQEGFWDAPDSALNGFMHWASRRASTPLVSAFCEMLQALSEGEECATSAHEFLLDEGPQSSGKMRRTHSLTWNQIFKELTFFSSKIRDRPALPQPQTYRPGKPHSDLAEAEPESFLMLECYLRLITRLCSESGAARQYLAHHPSFHIVDLLFQLASSAIEPRLRACAFTTLRSLLSHKTKDAGEHLWNTLDFWISGGYSPGSSMPKTSSGPISSSQSAMNAILGGLASGFEEPNAFVRLLHTLVLPYEDESGLHDDLSFPEQLGGATRMAGIDPYVDFVLGQIFAARASELAEVVQIRLLQLTCLDFIATCLDTFNEDLVVFASESNVSVDAAIAASSLRNYVLLHPFSRVMEWMYNDKVMDALFAIVHQDPADVARAAPDSPLILCLLRAIQVITSILELQPTYLDIIRPVIKTQSTQRKVPVSSAAFASFEDGVLNHLFIIPNLGHHCGTGHPELVIASLKLLQKLSASPKLSSTPSAGFGRGIARNKALAALDDDAETISKIMLREMESDIDVNQGPLSSAYIIKVQILDFLIACLRASPGRPTIAHRLLGFECGSDSLSVEASGSFSRGISLFHTILSIVVLDIPLGDEMGISSWLVSLNYKGQQVLKELWSSPVSSGLTMTEMRSNDSLFMMCIREAPIHPGMLWDGLDITNPAFPLATSASCLTEFLCRRTLMLQYSSAELHQIARSHSPSLKQKIFETLLGSTTIEGGQRLDHANIFDLFDFVEPEYNPPARPFQESWFKDLDFQACQDDTLDSTSTYNLDKVEELLILRRAELMNSNRLQSPQDLAQVNAQAQELVEFYAIDNRVKLLRESRLKVLRAWVQLTLVMIENSDFDNTAKTSFVLRSLQTIMPRLESDLENIPEAIELARLAKALIFSLDFGSESFRHGDLGDLVSDRLFHLFQVSLRAISSLGAESSLKEIFYNISYRYLAGMSDVIGVSGIHKRHSIQTIKSAGERFIDLVCDDAYAGEPTCRMAALLLLSSLVRLGKNENSKYIIEAFIRLNFIGILVDSIQTIPAELRETPGGGVFLF